LLRSPSAERVRPRWARAPHRDGDEAGAEAHEDELLDQEGLRCHEAGTDQPREDAPCHRPEVGRAREIDAVGAGLVERGPDEATDQRHQRGRAGQDHGAHRIAERARSEIDDQVEEQRATAEHLFEPQAIVRRAGNRHERADRDDRHVEHGDGELHRPRVWRAAQRIDDPGRRHHRQAGADADADARRSGGEQQPDRDDAERDQPEAEREGEAVMLFFLEPEPQARDGAILGEG
jgi:hypothetical protein